MDRLLATVGNLAGLKPEVLDKIDMDQAIDDYGQMYGVNPEIIIPDDVVAQARAARAKQQAAMQSAATMPQVVDSAKTASEIDPANLQSVMASLQGYNTPGAA
jgi:Bacteriophage head to tail connecting protein